MEFIHWLEDNIRPWCTANNVDEHEHIPLRAVWRSLSPLRSNNITRFRGVAMPNNDYVRHMKTTRGEGWAQAVAADMQKFLDVCKDGIYATADMKTMIRLSENFHLCDALDKKWSRDIRHKCSCPRS